MSKLYEITQEFERLEALYDEAVNEETGEIENSDILEQIEIELDNLLKNKSEGIVKYFKVEEANIKMLKEEEARLKTLRQRKEKKLEGFKNYIESNLVRMGKKKVETPFGNISLRASKKTMVNEDLIPFSEEYAIKQEVIKYDKTTIKKLLDSGVVIEGAWIEENVTVNIK